MNGGFFVVAVGAIGVLVISFQYMWGFYIFCAAIWALWWSARKLEDTAVNRYEASRKYRAGLIDRANKQHQQIMQGDEINGTYGQYLPPKGLRKLW